METVRDVLSKSAGKPNAPNLVPIFAQISSDLITPSGAYLKVSAFSKSEFSFLFESAASEQVGRYSFVGAGPRKILKTGEGHGEQVDPLPVLEAELSKSRVAHIPGLRLPPLMGGAVGYVGYDCVRYFEPKTARPMKDILKVPESLFMLFDTIVAFDRFFGTLKVITYLHVPEDLSDLEVAYRKASDSVSEVVDVLLSPETPLPVQPPIQPNQEYTSNIGQAGYEKHVTTLKKHIIAGDIIQAVPSQRFMN